MINSIVFGFDSYNSAGSVRCLGEAKIRPIVIIVSSKSKTAVSRSKYIDKYYQVKDIEAGIELLKSFCIQGKRTYLFATSDKVATALDNEYDGLIKYYYFPNCGRKGRLTDMMDKASMCDLAKQSGINVPFSVPYKVGDALPDGIPYPCLIKPLKSTEGSKQDIRHFFSKEDLEKYFQLNRKTKEYLIQQFIKKEHEILIIGCRTESGKTYLPAFFHKSRNVGEGDAGSAGFISRGLPPGINFNSVNMFLEKLKYVGPFSIEFGVEKGRPYFFEINLRNDGTINYYTKIGVNVPLIWIKDNYTLDESKPNKAYYIDEFGDFLNVLRGSLSFKQWYTDFKKSKVFKYYDHHDKGPFIGFAPMQLRIVVSSFLRKISGRL